MSELVCRKCGTRLGIEGLFCRDETCPYHEHLQRESMAALEGDIDRAWPARTPLEMKVSTDCGRATVAWDVSAFFVSKALNGTLTEWELLWQRDPDEATDQVVYACAEESAQLQHLLTYCESAMALGIEDCGFSCTLDAGELAAQLLHCKGFV